MEQEQKKRRENVVAGIVGAVLGSLVGVLCTVVIGQLGYMASISGLIMAVGALKGYELLGGTLSKKGAVISSVLILVMTYLAHRLTWAITIASSLEIGFFDSFLAMLYLFTLLGAVPTILAGLRNANLPDFPQTAAPAAAQGREAPSAVFYPGNPKWMRPLRIPAALSMLVGIVPAIALLFMGFANDDALAPILAGLGCVISSLVVMCIALVCIQQCNNTMLLMVRHNGTVWKVSLAMLNVQDTYRFTKKIGVVQTVNWNMLNEEERERAKASVLRAIDLLSSGQVMPGSALGMAVCPLTNLQPVQVDRWKWKCVYDLANGRQKKISIPKAYPGFAPVPGMEPAQEPVPARWGLLGIAAALALVFGLIGAGFGLQLDSPGLHGKPAPTPTPPSHTQPAPTATPFDPLEQFHVGTELGFSYTAVGYIQAPDGMFGRSAFVDAHVPYSEHPEYLDRGHTIRSAAHGMEVTVTIAQTDGNAADVVDQQSYDVIHALGDAVYNASETEYIEEYDVAVKQVTYFEDDQTKVRIAIFYADHKQDGYYLSACIVYQPELMDDTYPALLAELCDAYALNLPEIPPMDDVT